MRSLLGWAAMAAVVGAAGWGSLAKAEDEKPKYTMEIIMKQGMKGGLLKKVIAGDASQEERAELYAMAVALAKESPEKGSPESWKEKTKAFITATKAAVDEDTEAAELLKTSSNCAACHKLHK